jgi:hypothetical protein
MRVREFESMAHAGVLYFGMYSFACCLTRFSYAALSFLQIQKEGTGE